MTAELVLGVVVALAVGALVGLHVGRRSQHTMLRHVQELYEIEKSNALWWNKRETAAVAELRAEQAAYKGLVVERDGLLDKVRAFGEANQRLSKEHEEALLRLRVLESELAELRQIREAARAFVKAVATAENGEDDEC